MKLYHNSMARKASGPFMFLLFFLLPAVISAQSDPIPGTFVTTANVNVRQGPGTSYNVLTTIPEGTKIQVVGREGYWLKVQSKHGNPPGYIDDRYARPFEGSGKPAASAVRGPYVTTAEVNLREGPGLHYRVLSTIPKGIKIHVVGGEGDWLKVESKHGNPTGFIEKRFAQR